MLRRHERRSAVSSVDVEPDPALGGKVADRLQIIERAGRCGTGRRDDRQDGRLRVQRRSERRDIHRVPARRDFAHIGHAEPEDPGRASHGVVRVLAADQDRRVPREAGGPSVGSDAGAGGEQSREGGLGAAGRQGPAAPGAKAGQAAEPADDLVLEHRGHWGHLPDRDRLVERGGEGFRPDRRRKGRRDLVAGVPGVIQVIAVRDDLVAEPRDDLGDGASRGWQRLGKPVRQLGARGGSRYARISIACGGEVVGGERQKGLRDLGGAVLLERRDNVGGHDTS
jgi:hypothetical protein